MKLVRERKQRLRPWEKMSPAAFKALVQVMHEDKYREYGITSYEAIGDWFVKMGMEERRVSKSTIQRWHLELCLPVMYAKTGRRKGLVYTNNILLHAWCGTFARALTLPRWHPWCQQMKLKAWSQRAGTVRGRRTTMRRRRDAHLAPWRQRVAPPAAPGTPQPLPAGGDVASSSSRATPGGSRTPGA